MSNNVDFKTLAKFVAKGLAPYARNCKVCSYFPYTLQLFVTSATIFSIDFIWAIILTTIF